MTLQHYVLKTFIMYISLKAAVFLPVCWYAFLRWWAGQDEQSTLTAGDVGTTEPA